MALLKYTGLAHYRQLLPSDLKKVGVEIKDALVFARHEVTLVADDVAEAIHKLVGDEFAKVRKDTKDEIRDLTTDKPAPPQVQTPTPMTDRPEPASSPAGAQITGPTTGTTTTA